MNVEEKLVPELTREFFQCYPDYFLCRTLAINIKNSVTTYHQAVSMLARKGWAAEQNRDEIEEKRNLRSVCIQGRMVRIKDLTLREIMGQDQAVLKGVVEFYFKYPYAHGRTKKSRLLPRWFRTLFLSALLGHAKRREIEVEYDAYFELLRFL